MVSDCGYCLAVQENEQNPDTLCDQCAWEGYSKDEEQEDD